MTAPNPIRNSVEWDIKKYDDSCIARVIWTVNCSEDSICSACFPELYNNISHQLSCRICPSDVLVILFLHSLKQYQDCKNERFSVHYTILSWFIAVFWRIRTKRAIAQVRLDFSELSKFLKWNTDKLWVKGVSF